MWENICLANRNQILELIDTYVNALKETRNTIAESHPEEIKEFFSSAKEYRDSFNISHRGPIRPVYQLFCDLIDEAGGIATIATILASNNISIKNIGIIHNREFQQGVLQVEFYDSDAYDHAVELLRKYHYTVYVEIIFLFQKIDQLQEERYPSLWIVLLKLVCLRIANVCFTFSNTCVLFNFVEAAG